ncbi:MAG: VTT domain-containing protein [Magnetococcales bacterium]|nr:VTT domain-containing protein [Magnetococcales bacterium]
MKWLRWSAALLLIAAIAGMLLNRDTLDATRLEMWVRDWGWMGKPAFVGIYALATLLFLPGSLLTLTAGALFGPWLGGLLSLLGATLGASLSFLIARHLAGAWVTEKAGEKLTRLLNGVDAEGWRFVAFTRLVPIFPFNLLNYALGLTRIRFLPYALTSLICMIPGGMAYAWLGHAGRAATTGDVEAIRAGLWGLGLLTLALLLPRWIKHSRKTILILCLCAAPPALAEEPCEHCHAPLLPSWQQSRHHQTDVQCQACHGTRHTGEMAAHARRNESCISCHINENNSYKTSKHGVITTLEAERMDFTLPLTGGNLRAPTCAYCHLHQNAHASLQDQTAPCRDCHSPRFVTTWMESGARNRAIGEMKYREAMELLATLPDRPPFQEATLRLRESLRHHLKNLTLGVGHQSPDELWWHGQAALDGDLLRVKSLRGALERADQTP